MNGPTVMLKEAVERCVEVRSIFKHFLQVVIKYFSIFREHLAFFDTLPQNGERFAAQNGSLDVVFAHHFLQAFKRMTELEHGCSKS